jgi:hypothetical protein
MEKLEPCEICGGVEIWERWVKGHKLQRICRACGIIGKPRIPEPRPIISKKDISIGSGGGFEYTVFDRYGYGLLLSKSYASQTEAQEDLNKDLLQGETDENAGPYTVVLWPDKVTVIGEIYK